MEKKLAKDFHHYDVPLPTTKYSKNTECKKCGCKETKDKWEPYTAAIVEDKPLLFRSESILRTCSNCGWKWFEKPLDAED